MGFQNAGVPVKTPATPESQHGTRYRDGEGFRVLNVALQLGRGNSSNGQVISLKSIMVSILGSTCGTCRSE